MLCLEVWLLNINQHTTEEVQRVNKTQIMKILYVLLRRLSFTLEAVEKH